MGFYLYEKGFVTIKDVASRLVNQTQNGLHSVPRLGTGCGYKIFENLARC
jgi:hypothetical protein